MSIALTRIDDKLIHAQITWGWVPLLEPTHLIVVNDDSANDESRKTILLMAAENISDSTIVDIISKEKAITEKTLIENGSTKVLLVLGKPADVVYLIKNNIDIRKVSLGYMSEKPGKRRILGTIFVDDDDMKAFKELLDMGVELEYQSSPQEKPISAKNWM